VKVTPPMDIITRIPIQWLAASNCASVRGVRQLA
jgi:hypothetical protein